MNTDTDVTLQAYTLRLDVTDLAIQRLYFTSQADATEFWRLFEDAAAYAVPDVWTVARGFVERRLGINSDRYVVAHFASEQDRTAGQPDQVMTLTEALIQHFPEHSRYSAFNAFTHAVGGLLGGGDASSGPAHLVTQVAHSSSVGDFFKKIGLFLWSRTGPGFIYNTFFAPGNVVSNLLEETRSLDRVFGVFPIDAPDFSPLQARYSLSEVISKLSTEETTLGELPFVLELKKAQDQFWHSQASYWVPLARYRFVQQARRAFDSGVLSSEQFNIVMLRGAPRLPQHGPFSLAQLKERTDAKGLFEVQNLALRNVPTLNMVRFVLPGGGDVLYIPNSTSPFVVLHDETGRRAWINAVLADQSQLRVILSHMIPQFSTQEESDRYAMEALEKLGKGETLPGEESVLSGRVINGDLFESMRTSTEVFLKKRKDIPVATAWEGWRDTLNRNAMLLGPIGNFITLGTGIEQAVHARTREEAVSAHEQIADSLLYMAFDFVPLIKGSKTTPKIKETGQILRRPPSNIKLLPDNTGVLQGMARLDSDPFHNPAMDAYFPGPIMDEFVPDTIYAPQIKPRPDTATSPPVMQEIEFNGKKYFVADKPDAGDQEHYLLRVQNPDNLSELLSSGKIAKPDADNIWRLRGVAGGGRLERLKNRILAPTRHINENRARSVFEEVRSAYTKGKKSSNKTYLMEYDKNDFYTDRNNEAHRLLTDIRNKNRQNIASGTVPPIENKIKIDAANCGELARAAAKRIVEQGGYAEVWYFSREADHAFTVIGYPLSNESVYFAGWKDIWIVDPWANIVSEAPEYVTRLVAKMHKWHAEGKVILTGRSLEASPLEKDWLLEVNYGIKSRQEAPSPSNPNPWKNFTFTA